MLQAHDAVEWTRDDELIAGLADEFPVDDGIGERAGHIQNIVHGSVGAEDPHPVVLVILVTIP
jgi:hypothetical protein